MEIREACTGEFLITLIDRISGKGHPAAEYFGVEAPRAPS
jgi:hypothetical protein